MTLPPGGAGSPRPPFLVDTATGVRVIVAAVEREPAVAVVPRWPWAPLRPVVERLPLPALRRLTWRRSSRMTRPRRPRGSARGRRPLLATALLAGVLLAGACSPGAGSVPATTSSPAQAGSGPTVVRSGDVDLALVVTGGAGADTGPGGTLVLLHGGPGLSRQAMAPFEGLAETGRRIASYDQRGAGASSRPPDDDYGLAAHVADLEAVRRALGVERLDVLGQSWGGLVALAYAAEHPDRVDSLVLVAAAPPDLAEFVRGQERFAARLAALQRQGVVPDPLPEAPEGSCAALVAVLPVYAADPADPPATPPGTTCSTTTARETYADALDEAVLHATARALREEYRGRSLALMGDRDPFGLGWLDAVVAALPGAERVVVPGAGHLVALDRPDVVLPAIDRFLDGG